MADLNTLLEKLKSWTQSYINPVASMDISEAIKQIMAMEIEIEKLKTEIADLQEQLKSERTPKPKTKSKKAAD
jgi:predicted  nucleic acid-binding Zn-ribbon protein